MKPTDEQIDELLNIFLNRGNYSEEMWADFRERCRAFLTALEGEAPVDAWDNVVNEIYAEIITPKDTIKLSPVEFGFQACANQILAIIAKHRALRPQTAEPTEEEMKRIAWHWFKISSVQAGDDAGERLARENFDKIYDKEWKWLRSLRSPDAEKVVEAIALLEQIVDSGGECCQRCEGNGKLWADGKAHLPSHTGALTNCPECGGGGRIYRDEAKELAEKALSILTPLTEGK